MELLREKFASPNAFGPQQVVEFYNSPGAEEQAMQARRAYELVQGFLGRITLEPTLLGAGGRSHSW